jgi:predicted CxxxxCH...CXXCH cytochrome family protein
MAAVGCGTPNDQAVFDPDTQKHIDAWLWSGHAPAAQGNIASCTECHGEDLQGGMSGVACSTCHLNGLSAMTGCTSCHGKPPTGTNAPNRRGAHTAHNALPIIANVCDTCHSGAGSNASKHYNGAVDTQILSTYNAASGAAALNTDGTCSNVSCHGGQTTPAWLTGAIDVDTQCTSCHAFGTTEYNSFFSGQHDKHVNEVHLSCTICHDEAKLLTSHFTSLNTHTMEGPASATLISALSYTGGTCNTPVCHGSRSW